MRRTLIGAVLVLLILGGVPDALSEDTSIPSAIVMIGDGCTGFLVSPRLVATASHCVSRPEGTMQVLLLVDGRRVVVDGVVVWDSAFQDTEGNVPGALRDSTLDFALILLPVPRDQFLAFDTRVPAAGTQVFTLGNSTGIFHWPANMLFVGAFWHKKLGDIFVYRGDVWPGASGSPFLLNGRVIGILTHGVVDANPPLVVGAPSSRLVLAVEDYQRFGDMRYCLVKDREGKDVRVLCRAGTARSS